MSFGVLHNCCYGGFSFSDFAMDEFEKMGNDRYLRLSELRCHEDMIKIFYKYGTEMVSGHCAEIQIETFPLKYKNYYEISEYDGVEDIVVDTYRCEQDEQNEKIKEILQSTKSSDKKIEEISILMGLVSITP
jgi:hypothetical protein